MRAWLRAHVFTSTGAIRPWVNVLGFALTVGLLAGFTITWVARQQRNICGIIVLIDDRQQSLPPPTDPDALKFRNEVHRYRERLGC